MESQQISNISKSFYKEKFGNKPTYINSYTDLLEFIKIIAPCYNGTITKNKNGTIIFDDNIYEALDLSFTNFTIHATILKVCFGHNIEDLVYEQCLDEDIFDAPEIEPDEKGFEEMFLVSDHYYFEPSYRVCL